MNTLAHFLFNYVMLDVILGNAQPYFWYILVFSTLLDLDHLPYIFKVGKKVVHGLGSKCRSLFHELLGITLVSSVLAGGYFFIDKTIVMIAAYSYLFHLSVDFLMGRSRPYYPFSKKEVYLGLITSKTMRIMVEVLFTSIFGGLTWYLLIK